MFKENDLPRKYPFYKDSMQLMTVTLSGLHISEHINKNAIKMYIKMNVFILQASFS